MAFKDILGQDRAVSMLKSALSRKKLAHALVFSGPEGTGKKLCAKALAMELNCEKTPGAGACIRCPECRQIQKNTHPDVNIISPEGKAGEIKIETIRELRKEMHLKPVRARYKVFVLDGAHNLNTESSNALLKVLEEPPEQSVIILITSEPYSLAPTIASRCQSLKFHRLSASQTIKVLEKDPGIPRGDVCLLAKLSEGSPGKAYEIIESGLERRKEVLEWIFSELNLNKSPSGINIFNILKQGDEKTGLTAKDSSMKRKNLSVFFNILSSWYRDVLASAAGGDELVNEDFSARIKKHAGALGARGASKALEALLAAQEQVRLFANPKLVFEVAMIELDKAGRR